MGRLKMPDIWDDACEFVDYLERRDVTRVDAMQMINPDWPPDEVPTKFELATQFVFKFDREKRSKGLRLSLN